MRRRQRHPRRRLLRRLPDRAGLRLPDGRRQPCVEHLGLRQRPRRPGRGVRRRQHGRRATAAAPTARSVEPGFTCPKSTATAARAPRPPRTRAATAIARRERAVRRRQHERRATAARRPARSRPATPARPPGTAVHEDRVLRRRRRRPRHRRAVRRRQHASGRRLQRASAQLEPNFVCPTPGAALRLDGQVRRRQGHRHRDSATTATPCRATAARRPARSRPGWQCPTPGAKCIAKTCGDGIVAGNEQCDDGNTVAGDGCSATCTLEPGFACVTQGTPPKSVCHATDVRRRRQGRLRAVRRRQPHPLRRLLADLHPRAEVRGRHVHRRLRRRPQVPAGSSATTATPSPATAAARPASIETGLDLHRDEPGARRRRWSSRSSTATCSTTARRRPAPGHPDFEIATAAASSTGPRAARRSARTASRSGPRTARRASHHRRDRTSAGGTTRRAATAPAATNPYDKLVYLDAAGNPTTLTLDQQSAGSNVYQFDNQSFFRSTASAGTRARARRPTRDCSGTHGAQLLVHERAPLPVHLLRRARRRRSRSPATTTSGCSSTASSSSTSAACTAPRAAASRSTRPTRRRSASSTAACTRSTSSRPSATPARSTYTLTLSGFIHTVTQCATDLRRRHRRGQRGVRRRHEQRQLRRLHARLPARARPSAATASSRARPSSATTARTSRPTAARRRSAARAACSRRTAATASSRTASSATRARQRQRATATARARARSARAAATAHAEPPAASSATTASTTASTGDKCNATCTLKCGDGVVEPGEQCDNGAANNTGGYGKCNPDCTLGPRCGDGIKNGTEQCDDGKNDGSYGTCNPNCTLAGYCGDGTVQNPPETCDQGAANSATAYGKGLCTNQLHAGAVLRRQGRSTVSSARRATTA